MGNLKIKAGSSFQKQYGVVSDYFVLAGLYSKEAYIFVPII